MQKQDLDFILEEGEGFKIEFKEGLSGIDKDIVAFANTEGGKIFLGISDNSAIKGFEYSNKIKSEILSVARNCDPPISLNLEKYSNIVIIDVNESMHKPHRCSSGFYLRHGSTSQKLNVEEIRQLFNAGRKLSFEEMVHPSVSWKDIDKSKVESFVSRSKITADMAQKDIFRNLGMINHRNELNNAAVLFFCRNIDAFLPHCIITCALYKGKDKLYVIDKKDLKEDIYTNYEDAIKFLYKHLRLRYVIKGFGPRKEILEIPEEALKEAVVNAISHRDYLEKGAVIMIELFDNRIEITNPGGLIIKKQDFGKKSLSRNPLIFSLLQRQNMVEKVGSGILRMKDAAKKAKLKPPKFDFTNFFTVTFFRPVLDEANNGQLTGQLTGQLKELYDYISKNPGLNAKEISKRLKVPFRTLIKQIYRLEEIKAVERRGSKKTGGYWKLI